VGSRRCDQTIVSFGKECEHAGMKIGKPGAGQLDCAAAIGALLALPAGYVLGRHSPRPSAELRKDVASTKSERMPNLFAPNILSDPAVRNQHQKIVESLELACAQQGLYCKEAASVRQWLEKRDEH
jgi:hypothetical protein